ncbi:Histidinol dehydrogenase [Sporomusa silvacetica DSM 10669]|uniref:Histidinol dehydrogenase n=1 Tax=Sporomusa silvacetica DSM 10669 TaxID=1123289 RepID=A0ABZ3IQ74_9FIRM|nr:histidinol dehydrogenase [Sporomusa silvacetica]OZC19910.1 histidinol dehydrogenase [Sporomusa silvacetica DSM 10669]
MKRIHSSFLSKEEMIELLEKPAFDKVILGTGGRAKVKETFGEDLSAQQVVERIVEDVRRQGNEAVQKYTKLIDGAEITAAMLEVTPAEIESAIAGADKEVLDALEAAVANVKRFHVEQLPKSWFTEREQGAILGQKCTPLDRVGIYVPGGTAAYPSSVIMNAVPAAVAGVKEIIMVVPPSREGNVNPYVLAAAKLAGVTRIFKVGGAQAVAALAFGTETIPKVDKITGPGNIFVTLAKKAVYGHVDIDMLAGPSEILIVADSTADPKYVAADMLSQAEHDVLASSILITDSTELSIKVSKEVDSQLAALSRKDIAAQSIEDNGLIIITKDIVEAVELANISAPEHLELLTAEPFKLLPYVRHAGAIFMGHYSPEPLGDYFAGPNHVLPTGGTARFYSVLNVETFMKKTSIIAYTQEALAAVSNQIIKLAEAEGLTAHANAVRLRGN